MGDPACFLDATCLSCGRFLDSGHVEGSTCPHCGSAIDGDGPMVTAESVNTILYCDNWLPTVEFYRDLLGLEVTFSNDWFVEFRLGSASVSVADAARTSIRPVGGQGMTLSVKVGDLGPLRRRLQDRGADPGEILTRFGSNVFDLHDPEGHRLEFWAS